MKTNIPYAADAMDRTGEEFEWTGSAESNGEVFLLDTSPSSGEPAANALRTIADWPITDPSNMDAHNMQLVALDGLSAVHSPWLSISSAPMDGNAVWVASDSRLRIAFWSEGRWVDQALAEMRQPRGVPFEAKYWQPIPRAPRDSSAPSPAQVQPSANAEIERLRALAATCYAGLGAECNLPDSWLDALNAAANGEPFDTEGLLPFTVQPSAVQAEPELTSAQLEAGWHATFSTNNPFCPCTLKTFTKAVRWAEHAKKGGPQ